MKPRKLSLYLWIEVVVFGLFGVLLYSLTNVKETYQLLSAPFELLGKGLRTLSLSSTMGNAAAVVLFILICLLPILLYIPIVIKKRTLAKADAMVVVLCACLGVCLYYFINPSLMEGLFYQRVIGNKTEEIAKFTLSMLFYIFLAAYIMTRCLKDIKAEHQKQSILVKRLQRLLTILTFLYTPILTVSETMKMAEIMTRKVAEGKEMTKVCYAVIETFTMLPSACIILLFVSAIALVTQLKKEQYSKETVEAARQLSRVGETTVYVSLLCCIGVNLLQLVLAGKLSSVNFTFEVPILPLLIAYVSMLLANYFKTSNELYEDKQMII
ncbi:MAG: hypothetical protein Q4F05_06240 [bacterium]|nr:hypothetical protein [bacterium]